MGDSKLNDARRLKSAFKKLEEVELAQLTAIEQRLAEATHARDTALQSLNGTSPLIGLFLGLFAKHLSQLDRNVQTLSFERDAKLQSLFSAKRRVKGASGLVNMAEAAQETAETKRDLEYLLERTFHAQGPRKTTARR